MHVYTADVAFLHFMQGAAASSAGSNTGATYSSRPPTPCTTRGEMISRDIIGSYLI